MLRRSWTDWERLAGLRGRFMTTSLRGRHYPLTESPRSTSATKPQRSLRNGASRNGGEQESSHCMIGSYRCGRLLDLRDLCGCRHPHLEYETWGTRCVITLLHRGKIRG